jgi:two-component system response regulator
MTTPHILLVDDSSDDVELAERLLRTIAPDAVVSVACDGVQALELLHAAEGERLVPSVILLDLKMPRLDGTDVLRALRADSATRRLPVVMFSSSNERGDVQRCLELGANSYVRKPINFGEYENTLRLIATYWLELNEAPH